MSKSVHYLPFYRPKSIQTANNYLILLHNYTVPINAKEVTIQGTLKAFKPGLY